MNTKFSRNIFVLAILSPLLSALPGAGAVAQFPAQGDDLTQSLGQFDILVNPAFQPLMAGYPGYNSTTKVLTSPTLYDPTTVIGRSNPLLDGSSMDASGVPVGTAGTIIGDGNFTVEPGGLGPVNTREVHTQIRSLNMTGGGAAVRAGTNATSQGISPGEVESWSGASLNPSVDFPARSFFDVFVEVDLPAGGSFPGATKLTNSMPLLIQNTNLTSFAPQVVYIHGMSTAVPVQFSTANPPYWNAGDIFGVLQLAGHGVFQTNNGTGNTQAQATTQLMNTLAATPPAPVEPPYAGWGPGLTMANSNSMIFTNRGDDVTTSLGTFRLAVNPQFQAALTSSGYPGWNATTKRLTSPLLYDPATTIGRSSPLTNGSVADTTGVPVGSAGTIVSDTSLVLFPPLFDGPAGTREVHTQIRSLDLAASGTAVRAGTAATSAPKSLGEVQSLSGNSGDPYWDFPAKSFFDIFVDVDIPIGGTTITLSNTQPLIVENNDLTAFPPKVIYVHGNSTAVPVVFTAADPALGASAGDTFGILLLAGHGVGYNQNNSNDVAQFQQQMNQMPELPVSPIYSNWAPGLNIPSNNLAINLTCSSNITVTATSSNGMTVFYTITATGGCSAPFVAANPPSGSTFPVGTTTVYINASDTCGNSANCSFTVTVNPPYTPPSIICPTNIFVYTGGTTGAVVNFTVQTSGGCSPVTVYTSPYNSGQTFPLGPTIEYAYLYDCNGYEGYCSFTVTVTDTNATPLMVTCPTNITVTATSPGGGVANFTVGTTGGCPPVYYYTSPYVSGSTFPVGTTTEYVYAYDSCVGYYSNYCSFTVTVNPPPQSATVPEYFSPQIVLPPPNMVYISPAQWHALYNNGIVIRNVRHRFFTQNYPLPALGNTSTETFSSEVDCELSTDNGATFNPVTGTANVTVQATHSYDTAGGTSFFDTQMQQLDLTLGTVMLRQSPTLESDGQTTVRPVNGGYMISSFFDIFTEVSLDGGNTWTPANSSGHMEMRPDPKTVPPSPEPSPLLPPPNDHYVSPAQWHALFAQGIVITNVSHRLFTGSLLPPAPGATNNESFNSVLDLQVSSDGGNTFQSVRVTAPVQITVANASSSSDNALYDTEMTSLTATLPGGMMIRASQTEPSRGATEIDAQSDGTFHITSFFDIFTELSLDGGNTWLPATNGPVRMQLTSQAPEATNSTGNLPLTSTAYVSPAKWHALYANGIILTNVSHNRFTQTQPPPPSGGNSTESFGSQVSGMISMDGGASFQPFSAPANVTVQVNSRPDLDNGSTRYFDTQMTQLDVSGGSLSGNIEIRQSPTDPSLGRTSIRTDSGGGYHISSFFDVFTELSLDGGNTWSPMTSGPGTMSPGVTNSAPTISINCPSNITVVASSSAGATVFFTVTASGGCTLPNVVANPPSGSTFPIGTTTVYSSASDTCNNSADCSFTVTVLAPPIVLNCPSNITTTPTGQGGAYVYFNATASGGCTTFPNVIASPPSGSFFGVGTTPVYVTASDTCGNSTNCSFSVTVNAATNPPIVLNCPSNIVVTATGSGSGATVFFSAPASGGCSPPPYVYANPPSGSTFALGMTTVFVTASDNCGNFTNCSFTVTVNAPTNPPIVLNCPSNIVVTATGSGSGATVFFTATASGGCSPPPNVMASPPSGSTFALGMTTVLVTASDTCGNSTNCSFTVTVNAPTNPPIVLNCPSNIVVTAAGSGSGATVFFTATASGGCSPPPNVMASPPSGSTFALGMTTVLVTASDTCGNSTNCSFTVTVNAPTNPPIVLNCPSNIVVTATGSGSGATVFFTATASGGCSPPPNVMASPPSGSTFALGMTTVLVTASDTCGHSTNCSFTVTVNPNTNCIVSINCPTNITVNAGGPVPVFFTVTASDTCGGIPNVISIPPSGSTFPVGTTMVNSTAYDSNGTNQCSFSVTVNLTNMTPQVTEYFNPSNTLPPVGTVYISPAQWHVLFANGIVIRDVRHRFFTQNFTPPTLGNTATETFGSELDFSLSTDNGATYQPSTGTATVTVQVTHSQDANGISFYNTEMTQLSLAGSGFLLRASPTLQSTGQTTIRPVAGGYMISSFFDIFTEVSLDGGNTWTPAQGPGHVEMRPDPLQVPGTAEPTPLLPAPNDAYVSPALWHALYAQGIVIRNVSHKLFTGSLLPPASGATNLESFNSILDLDVSTDGGKSFQSVRVSNAPVQISVANASSSTDNPIYNATMTSLNATLPGGEMVRVSPTLPSRGMTEVDAQANGTFQISSFFDIFTEVSLDGGNTWSPATNGPVRMQLTPQAPEVATTSGNLPQTNRPYVSPAQWHAAYANGIYITNVTHRAFTANYPPPAPGATNTENFNSMVDGMISLNGGATFQPFTAPASVMVNVYSHSNLDSGNTRFFDTAMTSLNLSGGNLPGNVMVRQSPTKSSLGRTSVRNDASGYHISSFFDIFTEVSLDGGNTWSPTTNQPVLMSPTASNSSAILLTCSPNLTVTSDDSSGGAIVYFNVTASGGCGPLNVYSIPSSGDFFPQGVTTVTAYASDTCGNTNTCTFTVTVVEPFLVLNCSSNLTVTANAPGGAFVYYNVTASGGCNGSPSIDSYPPSGSLFPVGTTTVTVTAGDTCGNSTNCSFTVTVNPPGPITLNCSSNVTVTATSGSGATVFYNVTASGGCSTPVITAYPPSGSTFPIGTTTVFVSAGDSCGDSTNCSFTVTVKPPTYPPIVLNCSSNVTVTATSASGATVFYNVTASGGCSTPVITAYPPSGSTFPIGTTTVFVSAADSCGDSTNCSFTVTVKPPTYPPIVLNCSSNVTVTATSASGATVFYNVTASGGCSAPTIAAYPPSGSTFPIGTTTVFVSAADSCGDSTNCSFTVTVVRPPIVLNCSSNVTVTATGASGATVFYSVTASGGCSKPVITAYPPSGSTFPIGTTTVYTTAADACDGFTNCSFTVTVNGTNSASGLPKLYIQLTGTNRVVLAWPTNTTATYSIAQIFSLLATNWVTLSNLPTVAGGSNQVVLVMTNSQSFFRLTSPTTNSSICLVSLTMTNCDQPESAMLSAPTNTLVANSESPVNVSATLTTKPGLVAVVSYYTNSTGGTSVNCPDTFVTNMISPTILSSSWTVQGPGTFTASGTGLNAAFTAAGCGLGEIRFATTWQHVCDGGQSTTYATAAFNVNCANVCQVASVSTNCGVSGSMMLTNTTAGTNYCYGSAVTVTVTNLVTTNSQYIVTTLYTNAAGAVTTNCPPMLVTNSVAPTVVSNWWTVSGPGAYTNSGAGQTANFTPTNGGSGIVTFYLSYASQTPCSTNVETAPPVEVPFNVIQITNLAASTIPANGTRLTVGVGEWETLVLAGYPGGDYTWSTSAGGVVPTNGISTVFTAPSNAANATITVNYGGGSCTLQFTVIEPASVVATNVSTTSYPVNRAGAGMVNNLWFTPATVSFYRLQWMEIPATTNLNVSGYFASPTFFPAAAPLPIHDMAHGAGRWIPINRTDNLIGSDTASSGTAITRFQPWAAGSYTWPIPFVWQVKTAGPTNFLQRTDQTFTIDANGNVTGQKYGRTVTRGTNNVYTVNN